VDVILPKWGMTMQEATIVRWLKAEGDTVLRGEPLVDVETDKVDVAIEAPVTGTLTRCVAAVGDIVAVGQLVAVIEPS
jgi:pyruvate/2-oxoglutarate dehydrogenase complex dihydrolipoamide acyltransferase (E2) component